MDDNDKKPCDLQKNLQQMIRTTKQSDLERALQCMMQTTKSTDLRNAFEKMINVTRSFDQEVEARQKEKEQDIADAFQKMIRLSRSLEVENEEQLAREDERARPKEKKIDKVKKKVPRRIRSFPAAFKRNPRAVIKYFLGLVMGDTRRRRKHEQASRVPGHGVQLNARLRDGLQPANDNRDGNEHPYRHKQADSENR